MNFSLEHYVFNILRIITDSYENPTEMLHSLDWETAKKINECSFETSALS